MNASITHRIDNRPLEVAADNLSDYTEREHYYSLALRIDFGERGRPCKVVDHGVDGGGKFIYEKLKHYNADKKYEFLDGAVHYYEIKTMPEYLHAFMTFKTFLMAGYIDQKAPIIVPRLSCYYVFSLQAMQYMLDDYPHRIWEKFSPNDLAVRVPMARINQFIADGLVHKKIWKPKAQEFINAHAHILTREKRIR